MIEETKQQIRVREVRSLETVFDFDSQDEFYQAFIAQRKLVRSYGKQIKGYSRAESELRYTAEQMFYKFIASYLANSGLFVAKKDYGNRKPEINLWRENIVQINCEGVEVIPGIKTYKPKLEFKASKENLSVKSVLYREGGWALFIIEDFLKLLPKRDGIEKPKLKFDEREIHVASIEQIPKVLESMKHIYRIIGMERFEELQDLHNGISRVQHGYGEIKTAKDILQEEYNRRLKLLLPANL